MNRDAVMFDIKAMLERAKAPVTNECCIYRVPSQIREVKEDAYTPKVVSIGPFHHDGHPGLKNMETLKLSYCKLFLERTRTSLESWIDYIEDVEPNFRNCYSDTLDFTKEELTKIIFVDSAFIFELFFLSYYRDNMELLQDDRFLSKPVFDNTVIEDMLLLENQLPFFVLEELFNRSFPPGFLPSLLELTFAYFGYFNKSNLEVNDIDDIEHFTDLIRTFQLQHRPRKRPRRTGEEVLRPPSATHLSEVGVIFKKVKDQSTSLLNLTFSGKKFQIPQLEVYDQTELFFRNIMALEQCHYPFESYFTDYVLFLDFIVNTGKDVDILDHEGVLANCLGDSDSVAKLFNNILKNHTPIGFNEEYLHICRLLNNFHENRWNKLKSSLTRDYCRSPWQTAASFAAIILLIMSFVQTVCSILQVRQQ